MLPRFTRPIDLFIVNVYSYKGDKKIYLYHYRRMSIDNEVAEMYKFMHVYNQNISEYMSTLRLLSDGRVNNSTIQDVTRSVINYQDNISNFIEVMRDRTRQSQSSSDDTAFLSYTFYPAGTVASSNENTDVRTEPLSEEEISDATSTTIFSEVLGDNIEIEDIRCPISMETFLNGDSVTSIRHCGHRFKTEFLHRWFHRSSVCPVCRHDLLTPDAGNIPTPAPAPAPRERPPPPFRSSIPIPVPVPLRRAIPTRTIPNTTTTVNATSLLREIMRGSGGVDFSNSDSIPELLSRVTNANSLRAIASLFERP